MKHFLDLVIQNLIEGDYNSAKTNMSKYLQEKTKDFIAKRQSNNPPKNIKVNFDVYDLYDRNMQKFATIRLPQNLDIKNEKEAEEYIKNNWPEFKKLNFVKKLS